MKLIDADRVIKYIQQERSETRGEILGEWIPRKDGTKQVRIGTDELVSCSNCQVSEIISKGGIIIPMLKCFAYCPNCGAKMYDDKKGADK